MSGVNWYTQQTNAVHLSTWKEWVPMRTIAGVGFVLYGIAACSAAAPADIKQAAKEAGCEVVEYDTKPNMFNGTSAECADSARVYWFPTAEANKNHGELCKQVGGNKVASGKNWTKYLPSC
jgi:hypothetical protein